MKATIKSENSEIKGHEYKVKRINYDKVVINLGRAGKLKEIPINEVELSGENKVEDIILENKDLLKIKILRGMPQKFYELLTEEIEKITKEDLKSINILIDENRIVGRRNMWEKECYLMINNKYPIHLTVNGKKFKNKDFYFNIQEVEKEKFLELSNFEMEKIKNKMKLYGENLKEVRKIKYNILKMDKINI
ncbi:hypothetical protein [Clostridium massiliamazoniense]|uniref:hypothetical protein n=1 Tax=Clostridium massiliamazoniense TaxID=1347366 RepID=UPI0011CBE7B1|nr:hypothetical protein [Clostridium massiliamazoniense]